MRYVDKTVYVCEQCGKEGISVEPETVDLRIPYGWCELRERAPEVFTRYFCGCRCIYEWASGEIGQPEYCDQ